MKISKLHDLPANDASSNGMLIPSDPLSKEYIRVDPIVEPAPPINSNMDTKRAANIFKKMLSLTSTLDEKWIFSPASFHHFAKLIGNPSEHQ